MIQTKTTPSIQWNENLRVKVGNSVVYNGANWINVTGKNTIPAIGNPNWEAVSRTEITADFFINGNKFTLVKDSANNNPLNIGTLEINDYASGGVWDTTEFWNLAKYIGGDKDLKGSWLILSNIEEIPVI